ncbi:MAG TPA: sensor histidine kinase, partial [Kandleria vitulina]|nr:sensor histidine kinase [Kandleria vitulina]
DIPDDIELAKIDLNLFPRALDNLLNNSLKYNVVGTKIYYSVSEKNDKITIIYADDGVGISEEVGERIFDAFVTTNEARTSGKGTGLGMSIAKRIIELHGGTIELDSLEGYKTVFKIQLKRIFTE